MYTNRRAILKRLAAMTGGVVLAPACGHFSEEKVLAAYDKLNIREQEYVMVRTLCEILIPSGDGVKGANDLMIEDFVMVMVNDCLNGGEQEGFLNGLKALEPYSKSIVGKDLGKLSTEDWDDGVLLLLENERKATAEKRLERNTIKEVRYLLNTVKQFTIQGFITSKYFMTEIMPYEMVPGKFEGKVLIQEGEKVNMYG